MATLRCEKKSLSLPNSLNLKGQAEEEGVRGGRERRVRGGRDEVQQKQYNEILYNGKFSHGAKFCGFRGWADNSENKNHTKI